MVYTVLNQPFTYHDDSPVYWTGPGATAKPGNKPLYTYARKIFPAFIDFDRFIGKFQSLNSKELWILILQITASELVNVFDFDDTHAVIAEQISFGNKNLFNTWVTMLGVGVVFGDQLPYVTTDYDRSTVGFKPVFSTVRCFRGVARNTVDIHKRMKQVLGSDKRQSSAIVNAAEIQKRCPAPRLTDVIVRSFGQYIHEYAGWSAFQMQTVRG